MCVLGAVCGLLGARWNAACTRLLALGTRLVPKTHHPATHPIIALIPPKVPCMCVLGAVCGLLGALWTAGCTRLLTLRARFIPESKPLARNLEVVVVAVLTATVSGGGP